MTAPRTIGFVAGEWARGRHPDESLPRAARISAGFVAQAMMDELLVAAMKLPGRYPRRHQYIETGAELVAAHELFIERGWTEDPASYHATPSAPDDFRLGRIAWPGTSIEALSFDSGYEPHPGEPGRERWLAVQQNRTVHAWILRHREPRPWLVCLHALGMGYAPLDLWAFRAPWLHRELGLNLALPILPLHGPRRTGRLSGDAFMTYNFVDIGHGIAQSAWDVRRVIRWIRSQDPQAVVGLYGLSLGALVASVVAGLDDGLACVLAGSPTADLVDLFMQHIPPHVLGRAMEHRMIGTEAREVHSVVSPLSFVPKLPSDGLFIYASLGDRMASPSQAQALWEHWRKPRIEWFDANHVAFMWSPAVNRFVRDALRGSLARSA